MIRRCLILLLLAGGLSFFGLFRGVILLLIIFFAGSLIGGVHAVIRLVDVGGPVNAVAEGLATAAEYGEGPQPFVSSEDLVYIVDGADVIH